MGNATDPDYLLAPDAYQHGLMLIAIMPQSLGQLRLIL